MAQTDSYWPLLFTVVWFSVNLSGFGLVPAPLSFIRVPFVFLSRMLYSSRRENYIILVLARNLRCGAWGPKHKASHVHAHLATQRGPEPQLDVTHNLHAQLPLQAGEWPDPNFHPGLFSPPHWPVPSLLSSCLCHAVQALATVACSPVYSSSRWLEWSWQTHCHREAFISHFPFNYSSLF